MENGIEKRSRTVPFGVFAGMFLLFLLLSLDDLWSVWKAASGHGFHLKITILVPWIFCLLIGGNLWVNVKRGKTDREIGGLVLMFLGFIAGAAYSAMRGLTGIGH